MRTRFPILALLCVLASLLVPGIASAHSASDAEDRVWAFDCAEQVHVAGAAAVTLELHQGSALAEYDAASGSLFAPKGGGLDNVSTRRWYHQQLDAIPSKIDGSLPLRERALQAFKLRNQAKIDARRLMRDRAGAAKLDVTDPIPTIKDIVRKAYKEKGLTGDALWKKILESSMRSRPGVDKGLGLPR